MRFLFVDRILHLSSPAGSICGIKHITSADYYVSFDETRRRCFMPAMIGETLGQLTAWAVMAQTDFQLRPVAGVVASVEVERAVYVGETLELESWVEKLDDTVVQYRGEVRVGSEIVFRLEGALGPLLPMVDFIDPLLARRQFAEIHRPGGAWPLPVQSKPLSMLAENTHQPTLLFDHIISNEPGVRLRAVKHVTRAAPYFPDHFPHKPVLPLTVLLECKMNLAKEFLLSAGLHDRYRIRSLRRIKMSDFVCPGDIVTCDVTVKSQDDRELVLRYVSTVDGKRICGLEIVLGVR